MRPYSRVMHYLGRRHRSVLALLSVWSFVTAWLFAWVTSQTSLREGVVKILKLLPMKIQESMSTEVALFMDPSGALALAFDHPMLSIPLIFWAMMLPLRHIASEQERGHLDIILVRPVTRTTWLCAIASWQVIGLVCIAVFIAGGMTVGCSYYPELHSVQPLVILKIAWMQGLWALAVGSISALLAAQTGRFRLALGGSIAFTLIMILWEVLCRSIKPWKPYIILSLRHWAEPHTLLPGGWNATGAVVLCVIIISVWLIAMALFHRHDLSSK